MSDRVWSLVVGLGVLNALGAVALSIAKVIY